MVPRLLRQRGGRRVRPRRTRGAGRLIRAPLGPGGQAAGTRRLHVAFLLGSFDLGGTELNAVRTAEAIDRGRFALTVLGMRRDGALVSRFERAGLPITDFWFRGLRHPDVIPMTVRLARWLRVHRVDVLHCHDRYSNIFGALAGRLARVPLVITSRRFQDYGERRLAVANRVAYRLSHRVLANSEGVGQLLVDEGVPRDRLSIVPNFLDDAAFARAAAPDLRRELGVAPDAFVVGCVARLSRIKGHDVLLRAFARFAATRPEAVLVLVGDGEERPALQALADQLGVAHRTRWAGARVDAASLHGAFDVSVLASLAEGFPNVVIEAMAAGVPVVATAVGGVRDAVWDGETGLVVPPGDATALAAALETLEANPARRQLMGAAGRVQAEARYRRDRVLRTLYALWEGERPNAPATP